MAGFSITHLLILLVVVVLIFGTKKLANVGKDLGQAVKGFKEGVAGGNEPAKLEADPAKPSAQTSVSQSEKDQSKV